MENAYGIGITNRFALFLEEESDPLDILKQGEAQKLAAKTKKIEAATKPEAKAPAKKNDADKENNQRNNRFEGKKVFDARKASDGPREERNNQRNREGDVRRDDDGERRAGRGGGRGRGGPGGRGRGGPGGRGGKREFDRKSGDARTGIKPEEKRGGSGKGNWGNFEDDVKAEGEEPANTSTEEAATQEGGEAKEDGAASDKEPVPEEPKTLTLDEWKAQQSKKEGPKFNTRKAGEGQKADPKWKKATAYKKNEEEESDEDEEEEVVHTQRSNRSQKININFTFADDSSRGGGGGGRGRGRGGRGPRPDRERGERGGDRGERGDRGGERGERGDRGGERGERGGDRGERGERAERGDGPRRGGPRGGGRGGGGGGPRGGKKEFVLQQEAFPTLG